MRILATSREILDIAGESVCPVPTLSLPEPERLPRPPDDLPRELTKYEAVQLFVDRALLSQPAFAVTRENVLAVAQVCRRLDGIPLAIELAAARVRVLSVEQIAARLDDRFRLLGSGQRGVLPHQQTLRATMDWSYDLLSEGERRLLSRLSVFAGSFTLEACEAICGNFEEDRPGAEILDLLTQLVNKSLVLVEGDQASATRPETPDPGVAPRYRLLETIREYGAEKVAASGEGLPLAHRHRDWFCRLGEQAEPQLRGPAQREWLRRLDAEHDNLRAALRWCVTRGNTDAPPEEWLPGLRLGAALVRFWEVRGYWSEGRERLHRLLEIAARQNAGSPELESARSRALCGAGVLAFQQGDYLTARVWLEECLASPATQGNRGTLASTLNLLGNVALYQGDTATARQHYERSLALRQEEGDRSGAASTLNNLGIVAQHEGDFAAARTLYGQGLALRRELGDQWNIAASLNNLGSVAYQQGDYEAAAGLFEESLGIKRGLGDRPGIAGTLANLGLVALCRGDAAAARRFHEESLSLAQELVDQPGIARALYGMGSVARLEGDAAAARRAFSESLAIARELGHRRVVAEVLASLARVTVAPAEARALLLESLTLRRELGEEPGLVECLEGLAVLALAVGSAERAALLLAAAERHRETLRAPRTPTERAEYEQAIARIRDALETRAFATAWSAGLATSLEQALCLAQKESEVPAPGQQAP
jgi:predicted ATPase/Tfp pilus assembly protein PilF